VVRIVVILTMDTQLPRSFAEVEPVQPEWVWTGFIPSATVTLLAAPGGVGKSFLACDIAARVSRGDCFADGSPGAIPSPVAYISLEDSPEASTVHRLTAARADLSRVIDCAHPSFDITTDLPWLRKVNDRAGGFRLVVVDTLSAAAPVSLTSVATVRQRVLAPLLSFAADTGAAVLAVHHTTKAGDVAGSRGLVDGVRQVLTIERHKADPRVRTVHVHKTNVSTDVSDIRYTITSGAVDWQADIGQPANGDGQARIMLLLRNTHTAMSAQEIAARTGITYPTVRVLLHRLSKTEQVMSPGRNAYLAA
jgi:AAA domain